MLLLLALLFLGAADPDIRVQEIDKKKFVCFDEDAAHDLLELRLWVSDLETKAEFLDKRMALKDLQIQKWTDAYEGLQDQNAILLDEVNTKQTALEASNVWYRNNIFWGAVGVLLGTVLGGGAYYLFQHK
jgi:hypothetical protein